MAELPQHPATIKTELSLKLPAHLIRGVQRLVEKILPVAPLPDGVVVHRIEVPSRETAGESGPRYILVDVYESHDSEAEAARTKPVPCHISLHGSGFVTPNLGQDRDFTGWLAAQPAFAHEGAVVFDTDYRKAPEHPFPAPLEDVEDVLRYIYSKPDIYDRNRITVGGFSAGATLALSASYTVSSGVAFPNEDLKIPIAAVSSAYPATDMRPDGERDSVREPLTKVAKSGSGAALPKGLTDYFTKAYLTDLEKDSLDPRASVILLNQEQLPRHILVVAGEADSLFAEDEAFINKLKEQGHPDAVFLNVGAEGHGFNMHPRSLASQMHKDALHVKVLETILRGWQDASPEPAQA